MSGERTKWGEAGVLLLAGLAAAVTLQTVLGTGRHRALLAKKADDLAALDRMGAPWADERAWLDSLSKAGAVHADVEGVRAAAEAALGTGRATVEELHGDWAESAPTGWRVRRILVKGEDGAYGEWGTFVEAAGGMMPPWRVVEADLRAGEEAGRGAAEWVLETLEKQ